MKKVEYWRWTFRDPATDEVCRTDFQLTADEAELYLPEAEPIPETLTVFEVEEDGDMDTVPSVFQSRGKE
jgi:hypothetical protein